MIAQKIDRSTLGIKDAAVFTMVNNESFFLPIWIKHYSQFFNPEDLYILNHNPDESFTVYLEKEKQKGINVINVHYDKFFNELWRRDLVNNFQHFLITSYKVVIFCDVDELITICPDSQHSDLKDYISKFICTDHKGVRGFGLNVVSDPLNDKPIDINLPILQQRERFKFDLGYCKPYLTSVPVNYVPGFHTTESDYLITKNLYFPAEYKIDKDLLAFHLHYIDIHQTIEKNNKRQAINWCENSIKNGLSYQNLPKTFEQEAENFMSFYVNSEVIPERYKNLI